MKQRLEDIVSDLDEDVALPAEKKEPLGRYVLEVFGERLYGAGQYIAESLLRAGKTVGLHLVGGFLPESAQYEIERKNGWNSGHEYHPTLASFVNTLLLIPAYSAATYAAAQHMMEHPGYGATALAFGLGILGLADTFGRMLVIGVTEDPAGSLLGKPLYALYEGAKGLRKAGADIVAEARRRREGKQ